MLETEFYRTLVQDLKYNWTGVTRNDIIKSEGRFNYGNSRQDRNNKRGQGLF